MQLRVDAEDCLGNRTPQKKDMGPLDAVGTCRFFRARVRRRAPFRARGEVALAPGALCRSLSAARRVAVPQVRWSRSGGLIAFGRDGRMATYGLLVCASAVALWWTGVPARAASSLRPRRAQSRTRTSARRECGSAWVIVTSIIWPTSRAADGPPWKLTMRLHSVRPINSAASLRDGPSTRMRCTVPTRAAAMRRAFASIRGLQMLQSGELDLDRGCRRRAPRPGCPGAG